MAKMHKPPEILTIGHSNHRSERFEELLAEYEVEVLVDVRSWPHSTHVSWADRSRLPGLAGSAGAKYLFLGDALGGRPEGADFYDARGHVLYAKVAAGDSFRAGIERLKRGAKRCRLAIMCSEEDPTACHRRLLVGKVLLEEGCAITHIRGYGGCETESEPLHLSDGALFDDEESLWISSLSVSRARAPRTSSAA